MSSKSEYCPQTYHFRGLHPNVFLGTASDRYAGWIGQIYSPERYEDRITKRDNVVAGKKFIEEVLPVDSVEEYFQRFAVLEVDYTFYRPLREKDGEPLKIAASMHKYRLYLEMRRKTYELLLG